SNTHLAVIFVSDEDEASAGGGGAYLDAAYNDHVDSNDHTRESHHNSDQIVPLTNNDRPENLKSMILSNWPQKSYSLHAIVIKPGDRACFQAQDAAHRAWYGNVYKIGVDLSGGVLGSVCASDYAQQLGAIGDRISATTTRSITLHCSPY